MDSNLDKGAITVCVVGASPVSAQTRQITLLLEQSGIAVTNLSDVPLLVDAPPLRLAQIIQALPKDIADEVYLEPLLPPVPGSGHFSTSESRPRTADCSPAQRLVRKAAMRYVARKQVEQLWRDVNEVG